MSGFNIYLYLYVYVYVRIYLYLYIYIYKCIHKHNIILIIAYSITRTLISVLRTCTPSANNEYRYVEGDVRSKHSITRECMHREARHIGGNYSTNRYWDRDFT